MLGELTAAALKGASWEAEAGRAGAPVVSLDHRHSLAHNASVTSTCLPRKAWAPLLLRIPAEKPVWRGMMGRERCRGLSISPSGPLRLHLDLSFKFP